MDLNDKVITMSDGKKYLVIEQVKHNENVYLYLVNDTDDKDSIFVEIRNNKLLPIEPNLFEKEILPLFMETFKNN